MQKSSHTQVIPPKKILSVHPSILCPQTLADTSHARRSPVRSAGASPPPGRQRPGLKHKHQLLNWWKRSMYVHVQSFSCKLLNMLWKMACFMTLVDDWWYLSITIQFFMFTLWYVDSLRVLLQATQPCNAMYYVGPHLQLMNSFGQGLLALFFILCPLQLTSQGESGSFLTYNLKLRIRNGEIYIRRMKFGETEHLKLWANINRSVLNFLKHSVKGT